MNKNESPRGNAGGDAEDQGHDASGTSAASSPDGARLAAWAMRYRTLGWCVVPLSERRPMFAWTQYRTDPDAYGRDWERWATDGTWNRASGVGVLTEFSGIVVVDVDVPFAEASAHLSEVTGLPVSIEEMASGVVRTQSGRVHLYFLTVGDPLPNLSTTTADAIDCPKVEIKAVGACVPLPPTTTDMGDYDWIKPPCQRSDERLMLSPPPDWLREIAARVEAHRRKQEARHAEADDANARQRDTRERANYDARSMGAKVRTESTQEEAERALKYQAAIQSASEGGRYDALLSLAGKLAAAGFSESAAWSAMVAYGRRCDPPFVESEMREKTLDKRLSEIVRFQPRERFERDARTSVVPTGAGGDGEGLIGLLTRLPDDADIPSVLAVLRTIADGAKTLDALTRAGLREQAIAQLKRRGMSSPTKVYDAAFEVDNELRDGAGGQGNRLVLSSPEPFEEPVDGAELLNDIAATLTRFLVMPPGAVDTLALWVLHTYVFDAFDVTPYVTVTSPTRECGKTTLLEVLAAISRRSVQVADFTVPVLFRLIEDQTPSLFVDEASFVSLKDDLLPLLNSGYRKTGMAFRNVPVGDSFEIRGFAVYCPKAFARIGDLPDTLMSRSLAINMERAAPPEHWRIRYERELEPLRRRCARWARDNVEHLSKHLPQIPPSIKGRRADLWEPLLSIADRCGGAWGARARRAAELVHDTGTVDGDRNLAVLTACRPIVRKHTANAILPTSDILTELTRDDDSPFVEWRRGNPITARQLADALRRFKIVPRQHRTEDGRNVRCYEATAFETAFTNYLPPETGSDPLHPLQTNSSADLRDSTIRYKPDSVADSEHASNPQCDSLVADVADRSPLADEERTLLDERDAVIEESRRLAALEEPHIVSLFSDGGGERVGAKRSMTEPVRRDPVLEARLRHATDAATKKAADWLYAELDEAGADGIDSHEIHHRARQAGVTPVILSRAREAIRGIICGGRWFHAAHDP
ncbi:MAG: DUF3631 domain-containing protein [Candidatus Poribacteria bacterium]|nr:DUF3631 domain-containing protein [Candidatus Poribacteria bacterium]